MTLLEELCPVLLWGGKKFWDVLSTFQIGTFTFFCPRNSFVIVSFGSIFSVSFARFWVFSHVVNSYHFVSYSFNLYHKSSFSHGLNYLQLKTNSKHISVPNNLNSNISYRVYQSEMVETSGSLSD